jgi:hypothetical protein
VVDTYQKGDENLFKDVRVKTDADGNTTTTTNCYSSGNGNKGCPGGMTDEPSCRTDCARLAMLAGLFACTSGGADCGRPPEGMRPNPHAQSCAPQAGDTLEAPGGSTTSAGPKREGAAEPDCTTADAPGGPIDYGDPTDPTGDAPPDASQIPHLLNDGVTDPVHPGEDVADTGGIKLDMYGTLRDDANPPGGGDPDHNPAGGPPSTGEAERVPLP